MKGGVLIIGSLLWDQHQGSHFRLREKWRKQRLSMKDKVHVLAPIRYGRESGSAYTMVFSKEIEETNQMGTAFVVPFKQEISSVKGLLNQAGYLSEAEGVRDKKLVKGIGEIWCVIGILFSPLFGPDGKEKILSVYTRQLRADGLSNHYQNFKLGGEQSILMENGEIDMSWFKAVNPKSQVLIDQFDFVIATCTKPNLSNGYPDANTIKNSLKDDRRSYFYNNIENGITTYQDRNVML